MTDLCNKEISRQSLMIRNLKCISLKVFKRIDPLDYSLFILLYLDYISDNGHLD